MAAERAGWVAESIGAIAGATAVVGVFENDALTIRAGMPNSKTAEENFGNLVFMQTSKGYLFPDGRDSTRERKRERKSKATADYASRGDRAVRAIECFAPCNARMSR